MNGLTFKDIYRMYYREIYKYTYELAGGDVELTDRLFRMAIEKAYVTYDPKEKIEDYREWLRSFVDKKAKRVLKNRTAHDADSWGSSFYDNMNSDKFLIFISRKKRREPTSVILMSAVLILILSSIIGVLTTNGTAEAMVTGIQDKYYDLTGAEHMKSDKMYEQEFDKISEKTKKVAGDLMPNAFFPEEPFEGFIFSGGYLSKFDKNNVSLMLTYEKGQAFVYMEYMIYNDSTKIGIDSGSEKEYKGGTLHFSTAEDDTYTVNTVFYTKGDEFLSVTGEQSLKELEKYMKEDMIPHIE